MSLCLSPSAPFSGPPETERGTVSLFPNAVPFPPWQPDAAAIAALPDRRPAAGPPPCRSIQKGAQWASAIHRAYDYVSAGLREPQERAKLGALHADTITAGPDFARVRRNATFGPVPIDAYSPEAAREIMQQARQIAKSRPTVTPPNTYAKQLIY